MTRKIGIISTLLLFCLLSAKAQGNIHMSQILENNDFWVWIIIVVEGILLVAACIVFWLRTRAERIKIIIEESKRIERKYVLKSGLMRERANNHISMFEDKLQQLDRRLGDIQRQLDVLLSAKQNISPRISDVSQTAQPIQTDVKYLKQRNGNIFNQVSDNPDGCYFQAFNINKDRATFKFSGNEDYAINNKNEVFDDVCEVSGSTFNAKSVQTEENGEVILQDGKWKVIKKAKIKLI